VLRVLSDIDAAADRREVTLLGLIHLSAAFDCVDHLTERLQRLFVIRGNALAWISSFIQGRCQQVAYNGQLSTLMVLLFGVPQGSVLGPMLFLLYTAQLFDVITHFGLVGHSYADDTQVYISAAATSSSTVVQRFVSCVEMYTWMTNHP